MSKIDKLVSRKNIFFEIMIKLIDRALEERLGKRRGPTHNQHPMFCASADDANHYCCCFNTIQVTIK